MNDLISREAAIEAISDIYKTWGIYEEDEENTEVLRAIKRLPSANQWIPCSERLPDETGKYLVTIKYKESKNIYTEKVTYDTVFGFAGYEGLVSKTEVMIL